MKKLQLISFGLIAILAIVLRLYHLNSPVADWHSWRQVDTAAVARNFLKFGIDPLRPRFDDLSNIPSGFENPQGWRMAEFPLYQLIAVELVKNFPQFSLEVWLRLVTIASSVLTALFLGVIVSIVSDPLTGLLASFIFAVLPYSIYYGRTILPDPFMVFWAMLSLFFLLRTFSGNQIRWVYLLSAAVASAISLLAKPMAVFLLVPIGYLFLKHFKLSRLWFMSVVAYGSIAFIPILWWRQWILQFPQGIPVYLWLLNAGNIRFKGAWFYWLFSQRLDQLILGGWGLILFGLGLAVSPGKREGWFFRWWVIGALAYWIVVARGNVQHDYYQILILPVVCIYVAKGLKFLLTNRILTRATSLVLALASLGLSLAFSWYTVRTYYWINRPAIIVAGKAADQLIPKNAKVIAPYNGDTTFLYQINRQGWPIGFDIDKKIAAGAGYYVTVSPTDNDLETRELAQKYTVIVRTDQYAIIDLTQKK